MNYKIKYQAKFDKLQITNIKYNDKDFHRVYIFNDTDKEFLNPTKIFVNKNDEIVKVILDGYRSLHGSYRNDIDAILNALCFRHQYNDDKNNFWYPYYIKDYFHPEILGALDCLFVITDEGTHETSEVSAFYRICKKYNIEADYNEMCCV